MTQMVHLAIADDVTEAEEIQAALSDSGIESELQSVDEADTVAILVSESKLEDAEDVLAAMTDDSVPET